MERPIGICIYATESDSYTNDYRYLLAYGKQFGSFGLQPFNSLYYVCYGKRGPHIFRCH